MSVEVTHYSFPLLRPRTVQVFTLLAMVTLVTDPAQPSPEVRWWPGLGRTLANHLPQWISSQAHAPCLGNECREARPPPPLEIQTKVDPKVRNHEEGPY